MIPKHKRKPVFSNSNYCANTTRAGVFANEHEAGMHDRPRQAMVTWRKRYRKESMKKLVKKEGKLAQMRRYTHDQLAQAMENFIGAASKDLDAD